MKIHGLPDAAALIFGCLVLLAYCTPAPAQECGPIDDLCRADKEMAEWRQRDRDADDRFSRLQQQLNDDRRIEQGDRALDRATICPEGAVCWPRYRVYRERRRDWR